MQDHNVIFKILHSSRVYQVVRTEMVYGTQRDHAEAAVLHGVAKETREEDGAD